MNGNLQIVLYVVEGVAGGETFKRVKYFIDSFATRLKIVGCLSLQ